MNVPLVDLAAQHLEVEDEIANGIAEVFAATSFIGGKAVEEFERRYSEATGVAHCVGVANGTDALELALRAVGVTPAGEVIVPANTFVATAEAVTRIGARPVLVDVDPVHLLLNPALLAEAIGPATQAIVPVHLFGQVAFVEQMAEVVEDAGIPIVEDAAQSQGARRHGKFAGGLGTSASTSFYPGKNLGAAGDAGAVTTNDAAIADRVRLLANHGSRLKYVHEVAGMNSRLDTIQAVVLNAKLSRLSGWNRQRAAAAARYDALLSDLPQVTRPRSAEGNEDVWHLYVIRIPHRDQVLDALHDAGIGAGVHYPFPLHLTEAYAHLGYRRGQFPVAEQAAGEILSLPLHPHISVRQQEYVVETLRRSLHSTWSGRAEAS